MTETVTVRDRAVSIVRTEIGTTYTTFRLECTDPDSKWHCLVLEKYGVSLPKARLFSAVLKYNDMPVVKAKWGLLVDPVTTFRRFEHRFWLDLAYKLGFNIPVVRDYEWYKEEDFR